MLVVRIVTYGDSVELVSHIRDLRVKFNRTVRNHNLSCSHIQNPVLQGLTDSDKAILKIILLKHYVS